MCNGGIRRVRPHTERNAAVVGVLLSLADQNNAVTAGRAANRHVVPATDVHALRQAIGAIRQQKRISRPQIADGRLQLRFTRDVDNPRTVGGGPASHAVPAGAGALERELAVVSDNITDMLQLAVFASASVAEQITGVEPTGNCEPDEGTHATEVGETPPVIVGLPNMTVTGFPSADVAFGVAGQVRLSAGAVTMTFVLHEAVCFKESVAVHGDRCRPNGKRDPEAGVQDVALGGVPPVATGIAKLT